MSFLLSAAIRTRTLRAVMLAVAWALTLSAVTALPAHAELTPTPRLMTDALPARAQAPTPIADAARFCPRPTGRWWEDVSVRGCTELLAGRDHATPITEVELTWLDLGDLPAYATVDIEAIDAELAAYVQRLADDAAAAEQPTRATSGRSAGRAPGSGRGATTPAAPSGSGPRAADILADRENAAYDACLEQLGEVDTLDRAASDAYFDAHARCVDAQVPGYYERWAAQNAAYQAWLAEAERKEQEALARLAIRKELALQEIRDTCPYGGFASPTQYFVSSYDEIEYVITCYDGPNG